MDDEAVIETTFDADPQDVWRSLTEGAPDWMGEGSVLPSEPDAELWLRDFVTGSPRRGRVLEAEPARRLDFDWWPEHQPEERSHVSIILEPLEVGTRITVTERSVSASAWNWRAMALLVSTSKRAAISRGVCGVRTVRCAL